MVTIQIYRDNQGNIAGFHVTGHANTAPHGEDIVCAGISALTQSAVLGLQQHLNRKLQLSVSQGNLAVQLLEPADPLSEAILQTMYMGLTEIYRLYPKIICMTESRR